MQGFTKAAACVMALLCMTGGVFAAETEIPAPPSEPVPQEIIRGQTGELQTVEKVYVLPGGDDGSAIPRDNFTENEVEYTFVELKKQDNAKEDVKEFSQDVSIHTSTNDTQTVLASFQPSIEASTEDGYGGTLAIDYTSLRVASSGYGTESYTVSESRTYPNLMDADTSLVPKTITKDGAVLNLTGISWQSAADDNIDGQDLAIRYTANATYTGTGTKTYSKGYTATATYRGEVKKIVDDSITYTAAFQEVPKPEPAVETESKKGILSYWWVFLLGAGALGGSGYGIYRIIRKRKKGY